MGMSFNGRASILSRTDPRITGGVSPVAPPPTAPITAQPVGARVPLQEGVQAGPGGVSGARRGAGPTGIRKAPMLSPQSSRRGVTPPWLRRPVLAGNSIGG